MLCLTRKKLFTLFTWTAVVHVTLPGSSRMNGTRVVLEPELQEVAAEWGPLHRLEVAAKFERWARQLRVSARITLRDRSLPKRKPVLRRLAPRKAVLN